LCKVPAKLTKLVIKQFSYYDQNSVIVFSMLSAVICLLIIKFGYCYHFFRSIKQKLFFFYAKKLFKKSYYFSKHMYIYCRVQNMVSNYNPINLFGVKVEWSLMIKLCKCDLPNNRCLVRKTINRLMLSVWLCTKVITLSGFYCIWI
jgi:ABC-type xylose transport system permease subunit